jgi:hypothetical protein
MSVAFSFTLYDSNRHLLRFPWAVVKWKDLPFDVRSWEEQTEEFMVEWEVTVPSTLTQGLFLRTQVYDGPRQLGDIFRPVIAGGPFFFRVGDVIKFREQIVYFQGHFTESSL